MRDERKINSMFFQLANSQMNGVVYLFWVLSLMMHFASAVTAGFSVVPDG
jgi:hypothetical protein